MIATGVQARVEPGEAALQRALASIGQRLGDRLTVNATVREQHANTLTWLPNQPPDAVAYALSTEEVAEIVTICAEHGIPVIPFGTGTSLEGHVNAPYGGVTIDLSRMDAVLAVHPEDLDCTVQAGVTRKRLNEHLRDSGLFFPIDPGADASLGGMAATRASGTNAVRYGTMRDNVISLTAVMANGEIVRTTRRARKTSAGYDLTRLLVGSEGTLGIITELTLKLHGIPPAVAAGVCPFATVAEACQTVITTIQCGIPVARIELLDEQAIRATNLYSKLDLPVRPTLFVEFHGTEAGVAEQVALFGEIAAEFGGGPFASATLAEERSRLWQARHDAYWAGRSLRPGAEALSTDVCVPISRLADCVEETRADIAAMGLVTTIVGHAGDGNFHVLVLVDRTNPGEIAATETFLERLALRAIDMDGTCTGEHGIGQGKMKYLPRELGAGLDVMRAIKTALDPAGILNPGKVVALS